MGVLSKLQNRTTVGIGRIFICDNCRSGNLLPLLVGNEFEMALLSDRTLLPCNDSAYRVLIRFGDTRRFGGNGGPSVRRSYVVNNRSKFGLRLASVARLH